MALLPHELWVDIFNHALDFPSDFDLQLFRLPAAKSYTKKVLRPRLVIGRKLIRVCKTWREIATPLFYETVWITKESQVDSLVRAHIGTENSQPHRSENSSMGAQIKRLVFNLYIPPSKSPDCHPVTRLTALCGNLTSLHLLGTSSDYFLNRRDERAHAHAEQFFNSLPLENLQVLTFHQLASRLTACQWGLHRRVFERTHKLKILRLNDVLIWEHAEESLNTTAEISKDISSLPNIEFLCIPSELYCDGQIVRANKPVKHLILQRLPAFFFDGATEEESLEHATFSLHDTFFAEWILLGHCRCFNSLRRIDFTFHSWEFIFRNSRSSQGAEQMLQYLPRNVHYLGFFPRSFQMRGHHYKFFQRFCEILAGSKRSSQIKTVQWKLLSHTETNHSKRSHSRMSKGAADVLRGVGIVLLDADGQAIA